MLRTFLLLLLSTAAGLSGCDKDEDKTPAGLAGTWKLTNRSCYCIPAPTPNEKVAFTATHFAFYRNDTLTASGTYAPASLTPCNGAPATGLRFTASQGSWTVREATYTIAGSKLVLDFGGPCDAPVDTYELLP